MFAFAWLACSSQPPPEGVLAAAEQAGTVLPAPAPYLPTATFGDGGPPPGGSGDGVQVLAVSPIGVGRRALQASVIFDRPMVALGALDDMNAAVPLVCDPPVPGVARWAGTTTAVFLPEGGRWPDATVTTCLVAKGTTAVDGTPLTQDVRWTFETERPHVRNVLPPDGADEHDPALPITVWASQPITPESVAPFASLRCDGAELPLPAPIAAEARAVTWMAAPPRAAACVFELKPGWRAVGPLTADAPTRSAFQTVPLPAIVDVRLDGLPDPAGAYLAVELATRTPLSAISDVLDIQPPPLAWEKPSDSWSTREWGTTVSLAPRTKYTVTLAAGAVDAWGQRLDKGVTKTFTTGDYRPRIDADDGLRIYPAHNPLAYPFRHINADPLTARRATFDLLPWIESSFDRSPWHERLGSASPWRIEPPDVNRLGLAVVDLTPALTEGRGTVAVGLESSAKNQEGHRLGGYSAGLIVTDLGATLKVAPGESRVWATTLASGQPVSDVDVAWYRNGKPIGTAKTDPSGVAVLPGQPAAPRSWWSDDVIAVLRKGADTSVVHSQWTDGLAPWQFGIWQSGDDDGAEMRGSLFTDRGVYRPGDTVWARATFRDANGRGIARPEAGLPVRWQLRDVDDTALAEGEGKLDDRGGFDLEATLPTTMRLGDGWLDVILDGPSKRTLSAIVATRAYRAPAFRVEISAPAEAVAGDPMIAHGAARYLFGAPLTEGEATVRAWSDTADFDPPGFDDFRFGPFRWDEEHSVVERGETVPELVGGAFQREILAESHGPSPARWTIEAEVADIDQRTVANRTTVLVHPGKAYVGLKANSRLPKAGEPTGFELVAVTPDGKPFTGTLSGTLRMVRHHWTRAREKRMDGRWEWVENEVREEVAVSDVRVGGRASAVMLTPPKPGWYTVLLSATDGAGHALEAETEIWTIGEGEVSWRMSDTPTLALVADKARYAPGDTARVLIPTPRVGMRAWITVEREGVFWSEVRELKGTADTVDIPLDPAWTPNVVVTVVAVEGAPPQDGPDKGRPTAFVGMLPLAIDPEGAHLTVEVVPKKTVFGPRDEVVVDVVVQRGGKPVPNAGVTLWAVDEGVLSLTAYETPDAFETFHAPHDLSVQTADNRVAVFDRAPYLTKGAPDGGGGGEGDGKGTRNRFVTTATWQPDLRTGPDGRVVARFTLADNLTTFRIMAAVDAGEDAFGSDDAEVRVTRPLLVRPAMPRFLRPGDKAHAGVVLHEDAGRARTVTVTATASGVDVHGSPATVALAAHGAVEVPFTWTPATAGQAAITFRAEGGGDSDAVELTIPVVDRVDWDVTATATTTMDHAEEVVARPRSVRQDRGGLTIDLAPTVLAGAGDGVDYLLTYPHGCVEQVTSRTLAALTARRIREKAGIQTPAATLDTFIRAGLDHLAGFRRPEGGLSYWPGAERASPMGTAYAIEVAAAARDAGYAIDEDGLKRDARWLREWLTGPLERDALGEPLVTWNGRALAAAALARAGHGDAGHHNVLFGHRQDFGILSTARLLEAIARTTGADARTTELARRISAATYVDATTAQVQENRGGRWAALWGSDDLSTAAALQALMAAEPSPPLAPRFAAHLAQSRVGGRWHDTRATAGVLAALASYAERLEGAGGIQARVRSAGRTIFDAPIPVGGHARAEIPLADLQDGAVTFDVDGGRLYASMRLAVIPEPVLPRDEGLTVLRSIRQVGREPGPVARGDLLEVTLRVVTPTGRRDAAVVDPLPAGLEALDPSLATTSAAPQEMDADQGGDRSDGPLRYSSYAFDHVELRDDAVHLYASSLPAGVHTFTYRARATTPGAFAHPPLTAEAMYDPEHFGRTAASTLAIAAAQP